LTARRGSACITSIAPWRRGDRQKARLAPRCVKDAIEEKLFEKRRDLFLDLSVSVHE